MLTSSLTLSTQSPESQASLQYELKLNEMILIISNQKQSLIDCIAALLGLESNKLHSIICDNLKKCLNQGERLPRKLSYIRKDESILEDYRKYPELVNFMKITLQMISLIYQTKITLFYLNNQGILTGLIINQKGYQSQIKIARINNYFYQIKQSLQSHSNHSLPKLDPSSSSQSYKFYEVFDIQPLAKKIQAKPIDGGLAKSYSHIPGSPLLKKNISMADDRLKNAVMQPQKPIAIIPVPTIPVISNKQFDELSLQNMAEQQQLFSAQQLSQSLKFNEHQTLTQSMQLPKTSTLPQTQPQPQPQPQQPTQTQTQVVQQAMHGQQSTSTDGNMFYGYYSQNIYYTPYMMGQGTVRNEGYGPFTTVGAASVSPGKNVVRRQNSTLEINQNQRYTGRLKFFDQGKNYGFIIMDADESDIFVHCDDLQKAGISKDRVRSYKQSEGLIRFSFKVMSYFGKYKQSRKAVQLIILDDGLGMPSLFT